MKLSVNILFIEQLPSSFSRDLLAKVHISEDAVGRIAVVKFWCWKTKASAGILQFDNMELVAVKDSPMEAVPERMLV